MEKKSNVYVGFDEIKTTRYEQWQSSRSNKYKEYRKKWEIYPSLLKITDFPMHIDIETSSFCNLECSMCARTQKVKQGTWRKNKNLDFDLFKKIIDEGAKLGLYAINLNNFGEPLLNKNIPEMIKYAKDKGIIDIFFHTNGILLKKNISRKVVEAGLDRIIISIDSPIKEKYEQIRKGAIFDVVIQNLKDLAETRNEMGLDSPLIRINMIKFPDLTKDEVELAKNFFLNYADSIGFLELEDYNEDKLKRVKFKKDYVSSFICPQLFTRLSIHENGNVVPCCVDIDAEMLLGNIKNESILNIWNSNKLNKIREKHLKGKFYEIQRCRYCDWAIKEDRRINNKESNKH